AVPGAFPARFPRPRGGGQPMSTHNGFLRDICANPNDDVARLIYADWLDDQGDSPRADFIRLHCRLEALEPFESERVDLEDRAAQLRHAHEGWWLYELPDWARAKAYFRRGFVERVRVNPGRWNNNAAELFEATPLSGIEVVATRRCAWDLASLDH